MTAFRAWRDGIRRVVSAPSVLVIVWATTTAISLPLAMAVRADLTRSLGRSLDAEDAARGMGYQWMRELSSETTGLAATVTGLCFLLALGITPFVGLIPPEATAPALIIVGFLMFQTVREIDFADLGDGFSALLTLVLIPLTCSITNGIGVGVIVCVVLRALGGRSRAVPALLWLLAAAFVLYFLLQLV